MEGVCQCLENLHGSPHCQLDWQTVWLMRTGGEDVFSTTFLGTEWHLAAVCGSYMTQDVTLPSGRC